MLQLALILQSGLLSISIIYGFLQPILYIMELSQAIVQAIPSNGSSLLQLPYISRKVAKEIVEKIGHPITIQQFLEIPEEKRRALLSSYTNEEYSLIINIASKIPILNIVDASFKGIYLFFNSLVTTIIVPGNEFIPPESIVQFVFRARCIFLGEEPPEVTKSDLENETDDDDVEFSSKRKKKKDEEDSTIPYAHTPFYPKVLILILNIYF